MMENFHAPAEGETGVARREAHAQALLTVRALLTELFGPPALRSFAVRFWDGSTDVPGAGQPQHFTLVLRRPGALRRMFLPPSEVALAEAYLRGDFDIEGNLEAPMDLAYSLAERLMSPLLTTVELPIGFSADEFHDRVREAGYVVYAGKGILRDRVFQVAGKSTSEPLYPDDPTLAGNRRIAIVLLREAPVLPADAGL